MIIEILLNDEPCQIEAGQTITLWLASQTINPASVALALNGAVLVRSLWPQTQLSAGDELHLFSAIAGG